MNPLLETLKNLGPLRLGALVAVAIGLLAFFIFLMSRLGQPGMGLLYGDLEPQDSAQIVTQLEANKIPYELRGNGRQIMVPTDKVARLRLTMAELGLPSGGSLGYELFDRDQGLGTTSFVQNLNHVRALEGELARSISSLKIVHSARVHLVLPQRQLFSREKQRPSASIVLHMRGGARLNSAQVAALRHLVASAIPDMDPNDVSMIDNRGNLLARGGEDADSLTSQKTVELQRAYERRVARQIEELLERSVGLGKVRAEVSAEMDFDRTTENSEIFDPDQQIVRSSQTIESTATSNETENTDAVTVEENLPEAQGGGGQLRARSDEARTEETVNYEIGKTVKTTVRESGTVRRLSVAVLVDGTYTVGEDDEQVYQPRAQKDLDQLERLAKSAIGFDAKRDDTIELVNMRFAPVVIEDDGSGLFLGMTKHDIMKPAEMFVLGFVGLLVLLLVVRPVMARLFEAMPVDATGGPLSDISLPPSELGPILPPDEEEEDEGLEAMIDISRVEGRVRASSLRKIGEIVDKHPEEAVSILRNWLYQETAS